MKSSFILVVIITIFSFNDPLIAQARSIESKMSMPSVVLVSAVDIEEKVDGQPARVSTVELNIQPKEESAPHRHPGPVFGYILKGVYEFKVEGQPLRTLRT